MSKSPAELERDGAQKDYNEHIAEVKDLATMTRTRGWRERVWPKAQSAYAAAHVAFDNPETKPSDFKVLQRDCILFEELRKSVEAPVIGLNAYVESMPLFREIMPQTAVFDSEHGTVTLVDSVPAAVVEEEEGAVKEQ